MILFRSRRLVGAVAALLALATAVEAAQRPVSIAPPEGAPAAFTKLNANDAELYASILALQTQIAGIAVISGRLAALQAGTIDGVTIGGTAPGPGYFTTLSVSGGIAGNASSASKLATAQTLSLTGDASCSFAFDGSASAGCSLTLAASGVTAGTYGSTSQIPVLTVDGKGRVTNIGLAANGGGGVPATRQILASGLASGGGDLSADRTITVPAASQSDVATGTDTTKALTPYSVAAALAAKAPTASPAFTGTPTATTATAGDSSTRIATTAFVAAATTAVQQPPLGQVRLVYSSPTALLVKPYQGNLITINGVAQAVPNGGVPCSSSGIAAGTLTYEYLWMNGTAMACEVSTTGHATGANGVEIKSGDTTRTLVGMAYVATAATFVDSATSRTVASWFNRQDRTLSVSAGTYTTPNTSSASLAELSTAQRISFVAWADEAPDAQVTGYMYPSGNSLVGIGLLVDGTQSGNYIDGATNNSQLPVFNRVNTAVAEGYHYASPAGFVGAGTGTFFIQTSGRVRN